ncbi:zinc metallochaperone AztD [Rhodococcus opacus]|uniref:Zinc metallochaperone AztD n=1 Tax=Rhodococcus opacus TaxID=37919 RepID=A0AAX3YBS3_RHOOP|nr:zinc metallochaperone AztD [Rhodococcus opacus]MCZ4584582.1 zinc metallochaperone AztD [Rhodococcus opacus]WLF46511.1 zinc metallochaperone AztD [Rhodococcus opacus]
MRRPLPTAVAAVALSATLLTSCSTDSGAAEATTTNSAAPRLALSYDGGVLVLDAQSLDVVGSAEVDGFTRLNPAGDDRHVLVSTGNSFTALDTAEPALTDVAFEAKTPGHVVRHDGKTMLFDDGTGLVRVFDPAGLSEGTPDTTEYTTPEAHHGVAVELSDGSLLTTVGNEDERTGIVVLDRDRKEIARNEDCPGVHGEAVAADETVVVGCQNGLLIYRDGVITKVTSPDPYGRIGNQAGDEDSPILLGDYKTDPDAELERPERVSLTDTVTGQLTLVDLGTSYTFRSLGRAPHGEALVLGTDGAVHVIDPNSKAVSRTVDVLDPWTEPDKWQSPRPALYVQDHTAYVTDPADKKIHTIDLDTWTVSGQADLPEIPNEITGVTG